MDMWGKIQKINKKSIILPVQSTELVLVVSQSLCLKLKSWHWRSEFPAASSWSSLVSSWLWGSAGGNIWITTLSCDRGNTSGRTRLCGEGYRAGAPLLHFLWALVWSLIGCLGPPLLEKTNEIWDLEGIFSSMFAPPKWIQILVLCSIRDLMNHYSLYRLNLTHLRCCCFLSSDSNCNHNQ